jgi:hypothetical protein
MDRMLGFDMFLGFGTAKPEGTKDRCQPVVQPNRMIVAKVRYD